MAGGYLYMFQSVSALLDSPRTTELEGRQNGNKSTHG
jgi:hypothetical protein